MVPHVSVEIRSTETRRLSRRCSHHVVVDVSSYDGPSLCFPAVLSSTLCESRRLRCDGATRAPLRLLLACGQTLFNAFGGFFVWALLLQKEGRNAVR